MYTDNLERHYEIASQKDWAGLNNKWNRCNCWICAIRKYRIWKIDEQICENTKTIRERNGLMGKKLTIALCILIWE